MFSVNILPGNVEHWLITVSMSDPTASPAHENFLSDPSDYAAMKVYQ